MSDDPFGIPELSSPSSSAPTQTSSVPQGTHSPTAAGQPMQPLTAKEGVGPKVTFLPATPRNDVTKTIAEQGASTVDFTGEDFEKKLSSMLNRATEITKHDRDMALALFRVHLDRAEELDKLPLSMPVATVIGDNTGATLKALEIAQKSGDRLVKIAELLVNARKSDEANAIAAYKAKQSVQKSDGDWAADDIPDGRPA